MQNFQDTFETHKRSFISPFSICLTVPLINLLVSWIVDGSKLFFCIWSTIIFLDNIDFYLRLTLEILLLVLKPISTLACPWLMTRTSVRIDVNLFGIFKVDFWKNKSSHRDSLQSKALAFSQWTKVKIVKSSEYWGNAFSARLEEITFNETRWVNSFFILLQRWSSVKETIKGLSKLIQRAFSWHLFNNRNDRNSSFFFKTFDISWRYFILSF